MNFRASILCALASFASGSFAVAQTPAATPATKYVRAADTGGKLRNLASPAGEVVLDAKPGTLLAVRSERNGWLEVEPASGMKVWIYGTYLKKSNTPGVAEVSANSVRMRPLPSSDEKSFPLPMKLDRGERVRVIGRADATKPIGEDWVHVWSPAGATAWIAATETKPLASGEDARAAWANDLKESQASLAVVDVFAGGEVAASAAGAASVGADGKPAAKDAAAKTAPKSDAAYEKLAEGEKLLKAAQVAEPQDYTSAKAAFAGVIALSSTGPILSPAVELSPRMSNWTSAACPSFATAPRRTFWTTGSFETRATTAPTAASNAAVPARCERLWIRTLSPAGCLNPASRILSMRPDSPGPAVLGSTFTTPTAPPIPKATMTSAIHPKVAVFQ